MTRLTPEDLAETVSRMRAGDPSARAALIEAHVGLAHKAASKFLHWRDYDTIKSDCLYRLVQAVDNFPEDGETIDRWIWFQLKMEAVTSYRKTMTIVHRVKDLGDEEHFSLARPQSRDMLFFRDAMRFVLSSYYEPAMIENIIEMKSQGYNNKEVATKLGLSQQKVGRVLEALEKEFMEVWRA